MKQVHIDTEAQRWYTAQPQLNKRDWPYRSQTAPACLASADDIEPAPFDADKCAACGGKGWLWKPKNPRTGSLSFVRCETCN